MHRYVDSSGPVENPSVLAFCAASGRPVLNLPRAVAEQEESPLHAIMHGKGFADMLLEVIAAQIPALSALDLIPLARDDDFGRVEEWIPTKLWLGMIDAFFLPLVDLCFFEPCFYCLHECIMVIFYRGGIDSR